MVNFDDLPIKQPKRSEQEEEIQDDKKKNFMKRMKYDPRKAAM